MQFSVIGAQNKDYMCTMQELADGLIESKTIGGGTWSLVSMLIHREYISYNISPIYPFIYIS